MTEASGTPRRATVKSGPLINLAFAMMIRFAVGLAGGPHWAFTGLGFIVWLIMEVHRDLLSAIEHRTSGKDSEHG